MNIAAAMEEVCPRAMHYAAPLEEAAERYNILTTLRAAHWLGQLAVESDQFRKVRENMNYTSAERVALIFRKHFDRDHDKAISTYELAIASGYVKNPIKLANFVYANRFGNGDEASGDGWKFRAGGFTGLTFKDNYHEASMAIYGDDRLVSRPELIEEPEAAALSAGWFWHRARLNVLADKDDTIGITRKINGGLIGLEDRRLWVERFKAAL